MQRIKLITKIGGKALPHLGGNGKILASKISEWSIYLWNESQNEFGAKVTVTKIGNSQRSLLSPTEV